MKKIISIGIVFVIITTMLTSIYVRAEESNEVPNPEVITDSAGYYEENSCNGIPDPNYEDISRMKVIDHSIYYLDNNEYVCIEFFNTEEFALNATEITVKDYIDGIPVTRVNGAVINYKNKNCYSKLTKVNIPSTVKIIGTRAFSKLKKITELYLPDSITKIGSWAFSDTNIKKINIPRKLEYSPYGFAGMNKLKSIVIPKEIDCVSQGFFNSNTSLEKVVFESNNYRYITDGVFAYCKSLKKINFTKGLTGIDDRAFYESGLTGKIIIPKKCHFIGESAFFGCKNLTKVNFMGKNIKVSDYAFNGCNKIKSIKGTENITRFGEVVFGCKLLKNFTISKNLKAIKKETFYFCKNIKKLKILTTNTKVFKTKDIFKGISKKCKVYVKTYKMKNKVRKSGFKGEIFVNKKLK